MDKTKQTVGTIAATNTVEALGRRLAGKIAGKVGGAVVEPAIWFLSGGEGPDTTDVGLWVTGITGPLGAIAAGATAIVKSVVDDVSREKLKEVLAGEPAKFRAGIKMSYKYSGWTGQRINSMEIASFGGVAWKHKNGLWVYIVDSKQRFVCDYKPASAVEIYRPILPLHQTRRGRYRWTTR